MNIPRRKNIRLPGFDYASEGAYFVTLVTKNRDCLFGEIIDAEMVLSEFGKIVADEWDRSALIRDEIELGAYVVMPNHFHGIVHIFQTQTSIGAYGHTETIRRGDRPDCIQPNVGAYGHTPLQKSKQFQSPSHSLGAMVRGFKSAVTTRINTLRGTPGVPVWQRNYFDRINRNDREYSNIEGYILENPLRWAEDDENPDSQMP